MREECIVALTHYQKQIILWTKNRFQDYPDMTLEKLVAKTYDLQLENVTERNIYNILLDIYESLVQEGLLNFSLERFLLDAFKQNRYSNEAGQDGLIIRRKDLIRLLIAELQGLKVWDDLMKVKLIELGEVDVSLL